MRSRTNNKILVGHVDVDAGLMMLGDPCYSAAYTDKRDGDGPSSPLGDWIDFCNKLQKNRETGSIPGVYLHPHSGGHQGAAIITETGWGDGSYPVYVTYKEGRVSSVTVEFMQDEEEE